MRSVLCATHQNYCSRPCCRTQSMDRTIVSISEPLSSSAVVRRWQSNTIPPSNLLSAFARQIQSTKTTSSMFRSAKLEKKKSAHSSLGISNGQYMKENLILQALQLPLSLFLPKNQICCLLIPFSFSLLSCFPCSINIPAWRALHSLISQHRHCIIPYTVYGTVYSPNNKLSGHELPSSLIEHEPLTDGSNALTLRQGPINQKSSSFFSYHYISCTYVTMKNVDRVVRQAMSYLFISYWDRS